MKPIHATPIHVAFAVDAGYLPYCAVAILSLLRLHPGSTIHFLHAPEFAAGELHRLAAFVKTNGGMFHAYSIPNEKTAALPTPGRFGAVVWYRIFLPELLPDVERVLYLDADVLVTAPLDDLWQTDLNNAELGAVTNVVEPALHHRAPALGLADMRSYFNSGVLLLDLARMRVSGSMQAVANYATANHTHLLWPDQDALNVVFAKRWQPLHPRWNCQNSLYFWRDWAETAMGRDVVGEALSAPAILHFEGPALAKPWHLLSPHTYTRVYRATLKRTPWAHTPLSGRTWFNYLLCLLPSHWRFAGVRVAEKIERRTGWQLTR